MATNSPSSSAGGGELPRDPGAYRPSIHFGQQAKDAGTDRPRHLDGDIINGCIERGTATEVHPGTYYLRETFAGVTYRLVVNVNDREVVTGYPISINTDAAERSERWTATQIEEIRHFIATDPRT